MGQSLSVFLRSKPLARLFMSALPQSEVTMILIADVRKYICRYMRWGMMQLWMLAHQF